MDRKYPKFCKFCSSELKMSYPGGDPENGPARMVCSKDDSHWDLLDDAYSLALAVANAICLSKRFDITSRRYTDEEIYDAVVNAVFEEIQS